MAESASRHQLKRRRDGLLASLPALSQNRADAYRLNSEAIALGRTGVKYQDPQEKARLGAAEVIADDAMRAVQREIRQLDGTGLFEIRLDGRGAAAAGQNLELLSADRAEPPYRQARERGLHRYCCGCARETEHVLCGEGEEASIPAIRWPAVTPASGTTICVDCGQWRATASRPNAPAWSTWPRAPAAAGAVPTLVKPEPTGPAHDGLLESAAEKEGMPPLRDRTRRRQPVRTMKKAIATY